MKIGEKNLITDIQGLLVGNASDRQIKTGVTVLSADKPFVASVDVMGGAPGTRETDLLAADKVVDRVDALVLAGGSAFGLDAASAVADCLAARGRGFPVGPVTVPIVPAAILFDLLAGGEPQRSGKVYRELAEQALHNCADSFRLGSHGAGTGATTANLKGGLGSASVVLDSGYTVGALVATNPHGSAVEPHSGHFLAAPYEVGDEFGGCGVSTESRPLAMPLSEKMQAFNAKANTTIAIVATDACLDKSQLKRLAVSAQDGMARALLPSHTPFDGDLVFSVSSGEKPLDDALMLPGMLGHAAALCLARAIARAVYHAEPEAGDILPCWSQRWADTLKPAAGRPASD